jgi:hypothetical protein
LNIKTYVLIVSTTFVEIFLILRRIQRDVIIMSVGLSYYSCSVLMELEFSTRILEKYSNIKLHESPCSGSRVVPCVRTDRQLKKQS